MGYWGPDEVMALIKQLEPIRNKASENKESMMALYMGFDPETDARITSFSKFINVVNSMQLAMTFVSKHLLDLNWWKWISRESIPNHDIKKYVEEYMNFCKLGFVQFVFSTIESSLRIMLRAIDPNACNDGTAPFKSIYDCLFKTKLASCPNGGIELLDLMRLVRNTIHNNGVYFDRNGNDVSVTWNGTRYKFTHAQPVDFVTWEFLLEVSDAIRELMFEVIKDKHIQAVSSEIKDPFSQTCAT